MESIQPVKENLYIYVPNKEAPVFFTIAFAASGLYHIWQCYRFKCFKLMGLQPACAGMFTVGFALREYGAFNYNINMNEINFVVLILFIVSLCLIYVAPPLLELSNYHVLGRILYYVPHLSTINPERVMATFGMLSAVVEGLNGIGVSFSANATATAGQHTAGRALIILSLVMQLCVIASFIALAAVFQRRCWKANIRGQVISTPLTTLYISTFCIFVRSIYRMVQQCSNTNLAAGGSKNLTPLAQYEWFFYVFEAVPMLFNSVLWNLRHPRHHLPENDHIFLAKDGTTHLEGRHVDIRPRLVRIIDPYGLCLRKGRDSRPFWELDEFSSDTSRLATQA